VPMELRDALSQIADIRQQMARTRVFRGYKSTTTLFSAAVAVATAIVQAQFLPDPLHHVASFLVVWFAAASLCLIVFGTRIAIRYFRSDSPLERELTLLAVEQFIPCTVIGGLLTYILVRVSWESLWLAPGMWTILFGMGILASRQLLPRAIGWVGAFYLMCGLLSIVWARVGSPFSPWAMGLPFGVGQAGAAAVLYWKLERNDVPAE
jgi:hypothetical protein